jgi:hypothetical protein
MPNPVLAGGGVSPIAINETVTDPKGLRVGMRGHIDDRVFYFTRLTDTTALGAFKLAQAAAPVAAHVAETGALTGTTTVGSRRVTITLGATAAHANMYQGGYLSIQSATTGAGQSFRLKGHAAVLASGVLTADLEEPVTVATSGTTTWTLVQNPWADVVIQPTSVTAPCVGVAQCDWAAATTTAPIYGWLQTWGYTRVLNGTTDVVVGSGVTPWGTTTAGAMAVAVETNILQRIGVAFETLTTDNVYVGVMLQIAP